MATCVAAAAIQGLESQLVTVEVEIVKNLAQFTIVGLPDTTVSEARERIRSAIKNSGAKFPASKVIANLAPAPLRKEGSGFDVPLAVAILAASDQLELPPSALFAGELALDGSLRGIPGVLSLALLARRQGIRAVYVPEVNAAEASVVEGVTVYGVASLAALRAHCGGERSITPAQPPQHLLAMPQPEVLFEEIRGQSLAKRALVIAAAGGHNVLLWGSPGSGKTMLAKAAAGILPPLHFSEALELTQIYSVAGLLPEGSALVAQRPIRSPHHGASRSALVGGGNVPRPGEITLAHRGILFLDELAEFPQHVLESLRQPLEDRVITVARASGTVRFPAHFTLIAATNPCPCGYAGDTAHECECSASAIARYQKKLSGPLLDRIDLSVEVPRVPTAQLQAATTAQETTAQLRAQVLAARERQTERLHSVGLLTNAEISHRYIKKFCALPVDAQELLIGAVERLGLSARSYYRIIRVARTIADLAQNEQIVLEHVAEALQFRQKVV